MFLRSDLIVVASWDCVEGLQNRLREYAAVFEGCAQLR